MPQFTDSLIGENVAVATEYFKTLIASSKSGGSIGFIPFNINFVMDGLSGMKIYNELSFDTSFLPPGYTKTLDFIVTGVDHKLKDGDWETDVKVTLIPKNGGVNNVVKVSAPVTKQKENYEPPVSTTPSTPNSSPSAPTPPPSTSGTGGKGRPPGLIGDNAQLPDSEIVTIATKGTRTYKLYKDAASAYSTLKAAAKAAGYDIDAALTSAYRGYAEQERLYNDYKAGKSKYPAAQPGHSNHGWGKSIDLSAGSAVNLWLRENCVKYNWYWFGPKDAVHFTYGYNESGYPQLPQQN